MRGNRHGAERRTERARSAEPEATVETRTVTSGLMSRRGDNLLITNRKARHNYFILESWEAGSFSKAPR